MQGTSHLGLTSQHLRTLDCLVQPKIKSGRVFKKASARKILSKLWLHPDFKISDWEEFKCKGFQKVTKVRDSASLFYGRILSEQQEERSTVSNFKMYSFLIEKEGWKVSAQGLKRSSKIQSKPKFWVQVIAHALISLGGKARISDISKWIKNASPDDFSDKSLEGLSTRLKENKQYFTVERNEVHFNTKSSFLNVLVKPT